MSEKKLEIREGDFVFCLIAETFRIEGEVLYTPVATGDCWRIKEKDTDTIYYVQNFLFIRKD